MLNQFNEEVVTYLEEDGKTHCIRCGACVDSLDGHTCSRAQSEQEFLADEAAVEAILHN